MNIFSQQHPFYCGIDLHSKKMHVCIVDQAGNERLHRNFKHQDPQVWLKRIQPFREEGLVVVRVADVLDELALGHQRAVVGGLAAVALDALPGRPHRVVEVLAVVLVDDVEGVPAAGVAPELLALDLVP